MKAILLILLAALSSANLMAQGTVFFNNRLTGTVVCKVYCGVTPFRYGFQQGNGPNDTPAGGTDWTGWTACAGAGWSAQLWAAPGSGQPEGSLQPCFPITTFRTGVAAGFVVPTTVTLTGVMADAPVATLEMRVWDNQGGTITSWAQALAAVGRGGGKSGTFDVLKIGGQANPAPSLDGLRSFGFSIPEPSVWTLGVLGAALLVPFCCRRG
jgi:hypothetical protein